MKHLLLAILVASVQIDTDCVKQLTCLKQDGVRCIEVKLETQGECTIRLTYVDSILTKDSE